MILNKSSTVTASLLALVTILGLFLHVMLYEGYYGYYLEKHGSYDRFEKNETVDQTISSLLQFLRGKADQPPDIFSESEADHLRDVKRIFTAIRTIVLLSTLALVYLLVREKRNLLAILKRAGLIAASTLLGFLVLALTFSVSFRLIHLILFPQGNWQFPVDSVLIRLFPEAFFLDLFLFYLFYLGVFAGILFATGKRLGSYATWLQSKD